MRTATPALDTTLGVVAHIHRAIRHSEPGVTVDTQSEPLPTTGYWVGGASWSLVKSEGRITPDDVAAYVAAHPEVRYFGMWIDAGRVHLDAVDHIPGNVEARWVAITRDESSIYDIGTGQCEWMH